jgi:hypothetical protein
MFYLVTTQDVRLNHINSDKGISKGNNNLNHNNKNNLHNNIINNN